MCPSVAAVVVAGGCVKTSGPITISVRHDRIGRLPNLSDTKSESGRSQSVVSWGRPPCSATTG